MAKPRQLYETLHDKFNTALGRRIISHNHRGRRVEKVYKAASHLSNGRVHFGELCLALVFMAGTYLYGNGENLPNNTTLAYPLYQVSTLECRTQAFSSLPEECKIKLPLIHGGDYITYQNEKTYTDIYTVLWGASYSDTRDQSVGAHYGVDIATSKGTPLYAIAEGEVYSAEYNSAYGNVVKIKFKYKGEILYAIYAHMDKYEVKTGDVIKKGQKIWEVGNSGNTFGMLGGYHVHFEIDKESGGKPAYAFSNCGDVSKGHYEIIQKGLCRVELFQYTKDPIALLEGAKASYPSENIHNGAEEKPSLPTQPTTPTQPWNTVEPPTPSQPSLPSSSSVALDFSKVDLVGREFINKRDLSIEKNFGEIVGLNDTLSFTIKVKNKVTGEAFHGTLNQPILLIASNTNIDINPVSTVLISQGGGTITLTPKAKGNVYIAINLGTAKIWGLTLSMQ